MWVARENLGYLFPVDGAQHGFRRGDRTVDVRGDGDDSLAVYPPDRGVPARQRRLRHTGKGDLSTVGGAYSHRFQVAEGAAFVLGITHHHPDIVRATLHTLRLVSVERLAHLLTEVADGQAEVAGLGQQGQLHFLLACAETVIDVHYALVGLQGHP